MWTIEAELGGSNFHRLSIDDKHTALFIVLIIGPK